MPKKRPILPLFDTNNWVVTIVFSIGFLIFVLLIKSMTYRLELEIDNDDISFVEEFFRSVAFVKTMKRVSDNTLNSIMPKSNFIAEIRNSRSFGRTRIFESF